MSFLTARWEQLAVANYVIDPGLLQKYLPYGTELDLFKGECIVSLVAFMFRDTKVMGIKFPFHSNFEEVNLRFYVKRQDGTEVKRGVVFIREIVPKRLISFIANLFYQENYRTYSMAHRWDIGKEKREVEYAWRSRTSGSNSFIVNAGVNAEQIIEESSEEFILEHYWGYAQAGISKSVEYEVRHPKWKHYPVQSFDIDVDFAAVYGPDFGFLTETTPQSVFLAEGSEISVEQKKIIKLEK
jgi:uncharacterized protein